MTDPDCYYGDHLWRGTSACVRGCGARLRCGCGRFVREDRMVEHVNACWVVAALADASRRGGDA